MAGKKSHLIVRGKAVTPGGGPFIFGILNVTPDSFSDGGCHEDPTTAIAAGCRMAEEGADVIDVGGESTRPGGNYVPAEEQIRRTQPVISELARRFRKDGPAISIDTRLASVAKAALDAGATVVNDISALRDDPAMADLVAERRAGLVLMHMKGTPQDMQKDPVYDDVVEEICRFLAERMETAGKAGIVREQILVDPGIGLFGKTTVHNLEILRRIGEFRELGVPVLVGPSRKRFIADVLEIPVPRDRLAGTLAAVAACVLGGIECIRVHDVLPARQVADLCAAIRSSTP